MVETLLGGLITVFVAMTSLQYRYNLRQEHRLTRLETKVDLLLSSNGIDPKEVKGK